MMDTYMNTVDKKAKLRAEKMEREQDALNKKEKHEEYETADQIVDIVINEIWDKFDEDGNGDLDEEEITAFLEYTFKEMGESTFYSQKDFLECFRQFAPTGVGFITKPEMTIFIKKVAGLDTRAEEAEMKAE